MLVLTRCPNESIMINDDCEIIVKDFTRLTVNFYIDGVKVIMALQESYRLGEVIIALLGVKGNQARLGFEAPRNVSIHRKEVYDRIQLEKNKVEFMGEVIEH